MVSLGLQAKIVHVIIIDWRGKKKEPKIGPQTLFNIGSEKIK